MRCQNFHINKSTIFYNILLISNITPERSAVTLREKTVNIGLGVPVFVAVAGITEETVVAEAFQIAIFYAEESHQRFVVVDTGLIICGRGEGFYSFDEMKKHCVELCVMLRVACVSHSGLRNGVENGRQHLPRRRNNCHGR